MIKVLVSACLLGEKVRYNGTSASADSSILAQWLNERRVVPFCPEVAGGLGVPRPAAEITEADGEEVLDNRAWVVTRRGDDVTANLLRGAELALEMTRLGNVRLAILKDGSPSCGSSWIYDGTFSARRRSSRGVTAALLERHGIRVFSEQHLSEAAHYLRTLEGENTPPRTV